jgi:phosphoribosyl 1,2-cyclic phosphate phosphodiesterase
MVIQVDTPPDFRTQCLRDAVTRIDAVIYTHSHTDHILGFDDLRRFCEMENKTMPIYGAERTLNDLRRVFQYAFEGEYRFFNYIRPEPFVVDGPFWLGQTEVIPFDLPHGRTTTTGLVFRRGGRKLLAYFTDCKKVTADAEEPARGVTLVVDALRHLPRRTCRWRRRASNRIAPAEHLPYATILDVETGAAAAKYPPGLRWTGATIWLRFLGAACHHAEVRPPAQRHGARPGMKLAREFPYEQLVGALGGPAERIRSLSHPRAGATGKNFQWRFWFHGMAKTERK